MRGDARSVRQMTVGELRARLDAGERVVLVDVREPWEHELAALPGSVLIPLGELSSRASELHWNAVSVPAAREITSTRSATSQPE
mgnify:CR=1 FL=1